MTEQNEKLKKAEQRITDELASQDKRESGGAKEEGSKERRAQAERELNEAK